MSIMRNVQDADCSGRALAILLVAWVLTAMVASILLRWDYMWVVLMILTMLVLLICGYTAYNVKKAHARFLLEEQRRAAIRTVSGMTAANRREVMITISCRNELIIYSEGMRNFCKFMRLFLQQESSVYAAHLSPDLPPSYASVVSMQTTPTSAPAILSADQSGHDKYDDPPSYAIVVASLDTQEVSGVSDVQKNSTAPISTSNSYMCSHER